MYASAIFATSGSAICGRSGLPFVQILPDFGCRVRALLIALIEIQLGIQLGLAGKQLLQSFVMFEGTVSLRLVVHKLLLCTGHTTLLFRRKLIQAAQSVLDALNRPDRIRRIQVRGIRGSASINSSGTRSSS